LDDNRNSLGSLQGRNAKKIMHATDDQEKVWKWERAGWTFMGVLLLCGLVEILTPNALSQAMAYSVGLRAGGHARKAHVARLEVQVGPEATDGKELILRVASKHFKNLEVQNIIPAPTKVLTSGDTYEYVFPIQHRNEALTIQFYLQGRSAEPSRDEMDFSTPGALAFSRFLAP
jgi:hypothetical protein